MGEIEMPVEILVMTRDGDSIWRRWDGRGLSRKYQVKTKDKVSKILVDPNQRLLDYKLQNNYWPKRIKIKPTPYYPMIYDVPTLNPPDAYSIVVGPTYNFYNVGLRLTGRRVYDYMSYIDSRYSFGHRKVTTVVGHQIEHVIGLSLIHISEPTRPY